MSAPFISFLRQEIAALEAELGRDPRFQKLCQLRDMLALYAGDAGLLDSQGSVAAAASVQPARRKVKPPIRQPSETRRLAEEYSMQYMAGRTEPTPTRDLYAMLIARGVKIGGKEPISNLSAFLSRSGKFRSVSGAGWLPLEADEPSEANQVANESSDGQPAQEAPSAQ